LGEEKRAATVSQSGGGMLGGNCIDQHMRHHRLSALFNAVGDWPRPQYVIPEMLVRC
jgi:hypothetical protein